MLPVVAEYTFWVVGQGVGLPVITGVAGFLVITNVLALLLPQALTAVTLSVAVVKELLKLTLITVSFIPALFG